MCKRRFPGALQSSGSYVQSVIQCQRLRSRLLSSRCHWYCRGWTTEMPVLAGLPAYLFRRLQSVMNAAARLIYGLRHSDHISDALITLHWLRTQERVRFKTAVLMYKATHGTALSYLSQLVRVADLPGRRSLRSALLGPIVCWCHAAHETVYRRRPGLPSRRTHRLEQPAGQRDICPVSVNLPSASENISVPGLVAWHYH